MTEFDIVIHGGRLIDGTGNPLFYADIALRGDRIAVMGQVKGTAVRSIDARGLVVAPSCALIHSNQCGHHEPGCSLALAIQASSEPSGLPPVQY